METVRPSARQTDSRERKATRRDGSGGHGRAARQAPGGPVRAEAPADAGDDGELMARAAAGDAAAFAGLYHRYFQTVVDFVARRSGPGTPHPDIAQEVFLRAWRSAPRFRGESSVKTFFLAIAVNLVREACADPRGAVRPTAPHPGASSGCSTGCARCRAMTEAEKSACRRDLEQFLARQLATLGPRARQAIELTVLRKLGPSQAAEAAGCSVSTFRRRLERAVLTLQACLTDR